MILTFYYNFSATSHRSWFDLRDMEPYPSSSYSPLSLPQYNQITGNMPGCLKMIRSENAHSSLLDFLRETSCIISSCHRSKCPQVIFLIRTVAQMILQLFLTLSPFKPLHDITNHCKDLHALVKFDQIKEYTKKLTI